MRIFAVRENPQDRFAPMGDNHPPAGTLHLPEDLQGVGLESRFGDCFDQHDYSYITIVIIKNQRAMAQFRREPQFTRSKRTPRVRPLDMYKPITRPSRSRSNDTSMPPPANVSTAPGFRLRSFILRC